MIFLLIKSNTKTHNRILLLDNMTIEKQRGMISEERAKEALERLKRRGLIVDYIHASGIKILDKQGIDFIIIITVGAHYEAVPLQIKSSLMGVIEHNIMTMRFNTKNTRFKNIKAIAVNQRDSIEDIRIKIFNAIS